MQVGPLAQVKFFATIELGLKTYIYNLYSIPTIYIYIISPTSTFKVRGYQWKPLLSGIRVYSCSCCGVRLRVRSQHCAKLVENVLSKGGHSLGERDGGGEREEGSESAALPKVAALGHSGWRTEVHRHVTMLELLEPLTMGGDSMIYEITTHTHIYIYIYVCICIKYRHI